MPKWRTEVKFLEFPQTADFISAYSSVVSLISMEMYASAHIIAIRSSFILIKITSELSADRILRPAGTFIVL